MGALFDRIPKNLFSPLAAPGAAVYATLLLHALAETQKGNGLVPREVLVDHALTWLERPEWGDAMATLDTQMPGFGLTEEEGADCTNRLAMMARAAGMLRYLEHTGWLRAEVQADYSVQYLIPDYAFRILATFREIADVQGASLQGAICAIHDLLQAACRDGSLHVRLPEALRQTNVLMNSLRELYHNIGRHLEQVLGASDPNEILRVLFTSYRAEVMDRAYHQLRTTDHVSRFRPGILEALEQLAEGSRLDDAAREWHAADAKIERDVAYRTLVGSTQVIAEQLGRLDDMLAQIDLRHSQFVSAAVRSIERRMKETSSTSGALEALVRRLLTADAEVTTGTDAASSQGVVPVREILSLVSVALADAHSLYVAPRVPERFSPDRAAPRLSRPGEAEIAAANQAVTAQLRQIISPDRVRAFVAALLAQKHRWLASELPMRGPEDLALLIYLRAYGDGRLGYQAKELVPEAWVVRQDLGFNDFSVEGPDA